MNARRVVCLSVLVGLATVLGVGCGGDGKRPPEARLNEIQVIGTHNSYHVQMPALVLQTIAAYRPEYADDWEFSHPPLREQLDAGVRLLELDTVYDPEGGRYTERGITKLLGLTITDGLEDLRAPGYKVLHTPEADFLSTCWTLKSCLTQIRDWSDANPRHLMLTIMVQPGDVPVQYPPGLEFVQPLPIDRAELDALDAEILAVFPRDRIVTPDVVRGSKSTLREAVTTIGWPTIDATRGKVLFAMIDDEGDNRAAYLGNDPSLAGRVMFTTTKDSDQPDAAIIRLEEALTDRQRITELVRAGFIVRTRADADTAEARTGSTERRDAAIQSGAQLIATDYALKPGNFGPAYRVTLPSGALIRCNPVTGTPACKIEPGGG